jgi:hypothetical protein
MVKSKPTASEINAALARWDGWTFGYVPGISKTFGERWHGKHGFMLPIPPHYCASLDLIHGLEEKLTDEQWDAYHVVLIRCHTEVFRLARTASAEQCARALYSICPEEFKLLEAGEKREWRLVWGTGYTHNAIDRADAEATCRIWREFPPMPAYADVTIESRRPAGEWEREKEKLP